MTMTTTPQQATRYQVADLLVDMAQRRVVRHGSAIELSALNFDLLRVLIEAAPNVVTYDDLAQKVWGRHFVSQENVAQRIKLLRQGLADDASEPRYIETVRGKGYRLIPSVQVVSVPVARAAGSRRPFLVTAAVVAAATDDRDCKHRLLAREAIRRRRRRWSTRAATELRCDPAAQELEP
jgi:DNA-binding winged helix-turn-helix (wHTH) protein